MALSYEPLRYPLDIPQLLTVLDGVERDAERLLSGIDDETLNRAPATGWSAALCLEHLSVFAGVYVGAMERGLAGARPGPAGPIHPGAISRWFIRLTEPPAKRRFKAPGLVAPKAATLRRDDAWRNFVAANEALRGFARRCEGVDVNHTRFPNPFAPLRFTLGTGLAVTVAHHRRHVCQMERALDAARR